MLTLFALGTLWFWLLVIATVVGITALIENEQNVWADIVFVATMCLLYKLGSGTHFQTIGSWIYTHWVLSIGLFFMYLIAGALYSLVKWTVFLSDAKAEIIRGNDYFRAADWTAGEHKTKITHWMIYWPISGAWTIISNPVVKAFNRIFYKLENVFNKISNKIMKELIDKQKTGKY